MAEDMILQPILMCTKQDIRSASKISGLFSNNEIRKEAKDEVLRDFQRNLDDCQATDLNHSSLPMPYYELPQHMQPNAELDIPKPFVMDDADWDLGSFDVENNIDCDIFAELSDLVTTGVEVTGMKAELPPVASKPNGRMVTRKMSIKSPVSESSSVMPSTPTGVAYNSFLDHNYAAVVPQIPAMHPGQGPVVESASAASSERDGHQSEVSKTVKYVERRKKNNLASRRSRETRKRKYMEMREEVFQLERKNAEMGNRIAKLEWLSCVMKRSLFGKIEIPEYFPD